MTLVVSGIHTTIVCALERLLDGEDVVRVGGVLDSMDAEKTLHGLPLEARRYVFAQGYLQPKTILEQSADEVARSLAVNLVSVVQMCERVLASNAVARICVIGSESALRSSYDTTYALAKAALHRYVEVRALQPDQQLVCVAPGMIADAGMTRRRQDQDRVAERGRCHPKGRLLNTAEVAAMIHHLLYVDRGYTSNTVIRMDGRPAFGAAATPLRSGDSVHA